MNTKIKFADMELGYGTYGLRVGELPDNVKFTLMQRAFNHIMQNEASAVGTRLKAAVDENGDAKYNDAELATMLHDWRRSKLDLLRSGEFSVRAVGPRMDSDERIMRDFAKAQIIAALDKANKPKPKASDTEAWGKAVDKYLSNPATRAKAEAEVARRKQAVIPDADDVLAAAGL